MTVLILIWGAISTIACLGWVVLGMNYLATRRSAHLELTELRRQVRWFEGEIEYRDQRIQRLNTELKRKVETSIGRLCP